MKGRGHDANDFGAEIQRAARIARRRRTKVNTTRCLRDRFRASTSNSPLQIPVARGNHADIGLDGPRATESPELPLLQDTKQLRLGHRAHFAHFVEEQDPR